VDLVGIEPATVSKQMENCRRRLLTIKKLFADKTGKTGSVVVKSKILLPGN